MRLRLVIAGILAGLLFQNSFSQEPEDNNDYQYALIEAVKQKNLGNFPEAIKLYKLVIKERSEVAVAHYELGTIFLMSNQPESAEIYFKNAYDLDPENYWYIGGYVEVLVANEKYKEAEKILINLSKESDDKVEYTFQLARLYVASDKPKKAIKVLNGIEKEYGLSEKVTLLKASVYESMEEYDQAKEEIDKVLDTFPESLQFRIVAAELCVKSGNEDEAAVYYKQVFEIDSTNIFALTNLTDYYRKKEDYASSFFYMEKSFNNDFIDKQRKLAILSYYVSEEVYVNGYREEMENLVTSYLVKYPDDADGKLVAVDFYIKSQDYINAYNVLDEYLELKSAPYPIWLQGALLANAAGMNEELIDITNRALNFYRDSVDLVFFKSIGLYGLERYEEVITSLEEIDFENYSNTEYQKSSYNLLAEAFNHTKNFESADELYEKILEDYPGDYIAMNNYSYYLAERGESLERAKSLSYKTILNNPDNPTFLDTYAWVLYKLGEFSNSEEYIREALSKGGENDPDINEHAGDIHTALKSKEIAKRFYEKAIILGGDKERLEEKIDNIPYE